MVLSYEQVINRLNKWYYNEVFIAVLYMGWFLFFSLIFAVILSFKKSQLLKMVNRLNKEIINYEAHLSHLIYQIENKEVMINEIIKDAEKQAVESITDLLNEQLKQKEELRKLEDEIENATAKVDKVEKQINTQTNKLEKIKKLYRAVEYSINNYQELSELESLELEDLCPTVVLKIHSMDVKSLRKAYKENEKTINELLIKYEARS